MEHQIRLIAENGWMKISLKTLSDAECGVGDLEIFSVYPRLFGVFFSSFASLPECPKYKPSTTQLSCGFYVWIKPDFYENILDILYDTFINLSVIWASVWLVFLFLYFRMFSFSETKKTISI